MISFEKLFTAVLGNNISEKEIGKVGKNSETLHFGKATTAESALAGAYVSYLSSQGVRLTQDQISDLSNKIESSLKRYKNKAKNFNS